MNLQYRIKVEEKNNNRKNHIPQVGTPKLTICKRSIYPWLDWKNLIPQSTSLKIILEVHTSDNIGYSLLSEQEAEEVIEFYKNKMKKAEDNKVKNVYYINK